MIPMCVPLTGNFGSQSILIASSHLSTRPLTHSSTRLQTNTQSIFHRFIRSFSPIDSRSDLVDGDSGAASAGTAAGKGATRAGAALRKAVEKTAGAARVDKGLGSGGNGESSAITLVTDRSGSRGRKRE